MSADSMVQFFEQFAESMSATLGQLTGSTTTHEIALNQEPTDADLWAKIELKGESSQQLLLGYTQKTGLLLARAMLSEVPGEETTLSAEDEELLTEFWRQVVGRASTDMKPMLGDSQLTYIDAKSTDGQPAARATLSFKSEKLSCVLAMSLSMELVRRLATPQTEASSVKAEGPQPPLSANNLDLLLNVPLAVTLRFGKQRMPLRNILQLASGSVIELDRQADDPVDLLLDERLVARGQVVVVDGCYGLRVSEVCR